MHPIIVEFGPVKVYAYGLSVALAFMVATILLKLEASRRGISGEKIINLYLCVAISGVFGARLLYALQNVSSYFNYPSRILMFQEGGLSFYGGFILATICAVIFLRKQNLPVFSTLDIIAPYLALGQAIGRIGCFLNGCCYGTPADFKLAVYFPGEDIPRHPTQLYSSLSLLLIFVALRTLQTKKKHYLAGEIFFLYCSFYSLMRFFMEYLRADNVRILANLSLHQVISIGIFVISGGWLWIRRRNLSLRSKLKTRV